MYNVVFVYYKYIFAVLLFINGFLWNQHGFLFLDKEFDCARFAVS